MTSSLVPLKMGTQSMLLGSKPSDSESAFFIRSHCDTLLTFRICNQEERALACMFEIDAAYKVRSKRLVNC